MPRVRLFAGARFFSTARKIAAAAACIVTAALVLAPSHSTRAQSQATSPPNGPVIPVGPQYDSTHVYLATADFDAFVKSFIATFGGTASQRTTYNVLSVPSSTQFQSVVSPGGVLSIFAFQTPIPYPFGSERTGYLVTNMDQAIKAARAAGADVIVEPFKDPIGLDAVIEWPGGLRMQLYWHFKSPTAPPLQTIPENRVYASADTVETFLHSFLSFSNGKILSEDAHADAAEIGRPNETFRRITLTSLFGNVRIFVTDGHLPYPFGREVTGYQATDFKSTLEKSKSSGAKILAGPLTLVDRDTAIVEFPGGYIAEIHDLTAPTSRPR